MQVSEPIASRLAGLGMNIVFGGAGENVAGLTPSVEHSENIRPVITRAGQAASFMACGLAMFEGRSASPPALRSMPAEDHDMDGDMGGPLCSIRSL